MRRRWADAGRYRARNEIMWIRTEISCVLTYPPEWATEYRREGVVEAWRLKCPDLFRRYLTGRTHPGKLAANPESLDMFAQYALMYILRDIEGIESISWLNAARLSPSGVNKTRIEAHWAVMRKFMGD